MAEGTVTVMAGWALWSKQPGTRQDYSVIACSPEPFSRTDYAAIVTRFAVGNPNANSAGPSALPWVTVSWVGVDSNPHLGISITSDSGQVDGVGRPITQTAYFCVPYAQLTRTPVSYRDLFDAVMSQSQSSWLRADGPMVRLTVPTMSADRLASTVQRVGEQAATAAAALLLSTRTVNVVQAESTSLPDRLDFIDAVASLLPYGYRTRFSGATWSDTGAKHRVMLAFAARLGEGAAAVYWRRAVDVPARDRLATTYCDLLRRLAREPAQGSDGLGLPAVIRHLANDAAPRTFEQPQDAVKSLNQLDLPFRVLRAIRERTGADLAELRQVLQSGRAKELASEADRFALVAELANRGDAHDWPQLKYEASKLSRPDDRIRVLSAFGRRMLWVATPHEGAVARDCLRTAAEFSVEDAVLAGLVRLPGVAGDLPASLRAAAELLADTVVTSRREYPRTCEVFASDLVMAAEYVAALSRLGGASGFMRWFDPQGSTAFARAFRPALGIDRDGWVSEADLAGFGPSSGQLSWLLLQVASRTSCLEKVLPGFTNWLAACGELGTDEQQYWAARLRELEPADPRSQAYLDTALLMTGGLPSRLPPSQSEAGAEYGSALAGIWSGLSRTYPSFNAEGCVHALARYLGERPWAQTREQAHSVVKLEASLRVFDPDVALADVVAATLVATPEARNWEFAHDWLAWAASREPEAVHGRLLDSLAAPASSDPDYLAGLCLSACTGGVDPGAALSRLAQSAALTSAAQIYDLFNALRQRFEEAEVPDGSTAAWQSEFVALAAHGRFGEEFLPELRAIFFGRATQAVRYHLGLLAAFAGDGRDGRDREYEWTEAEHKELTALASELGSMLKKSRKSPLARMRRIPFADGNHEDQLTVGRNLGGKAEAEPGPAHAPTVPCDEPERSIGMAPTIAVPGRPE